MEKVDYDTIVEIPLDVMWNFVKEINNWAPLVKGYQSHEEIDDKESIWVVRGDFGPFSRVTKFHNTITEWKEGQGVSFELKGMNEPLSGYGKVQLESIDGGDNTRIFSELGFEAGGALGPLINRLIKPLVQGMAEDLVKKIIAALLPNENKVGSSQN